MLHTDRLETLSKRFDEIDAALADTSGGFDQARFTALMRQGHEYVQGRRASAERRP